MFSCRVVDDEILLTMDDGRSALKTLELDGKEVVELKRIIAATFNLVTLFDKFLQGSVESERAQS